MTAPDRGKVTGQEAGRVLGAGWGLTPGSVGRGPLSFWRPLRPVPRSPTGAGGGVSWAAGGPRLMVSRSLPEGPSSGGSRGGGFPRRGGSSGGRAPPTERERRCQQPNHIRPFVSGSSSLCLEQVSSYMLGTEQSPLSTSTTSMLMKPQQVDTQSIDGILKTHRC